MPGPVPDSTTMTTSEWAPRWSTTVTELYTRSTLILKVLRPISEEITWMPNGQALMCFLGLSPVLRRGYRDLGNRRITAIAYG